MGNVFRRFVIVFVVIAGFFPLFLPNLPAFAQDAIVTFEIRSYEILDNTLYSDDALAEVLAPFTGPDRVAEDVELARDALEKYHHTQGYPTVVVNIPEQSVEDGVVMLQVIESTIRRVRVTGNRFFTMEKILKELPSLSRGNILYIPDVQSELASLNQHSDLKVAPVLAPGKELGQIDVELKVKDKLPLHGSLELNNRNTHTTSDLRLNGMLTYTNLWQKEHAISLQFQTAPEDTREVQALTAAYVMPSPWNDEQTLMMYALWSDSESAFGEGFEVMGKGVMVGVRNIVSLPGTSGYAHSVSYGLDYKDFEEEIGYEDDSEASIITPVSYFPFSIAYNALLRDDGGYTQFSFTANMLFRHMAGERSEFEDKRYKSRGNYIYSRLDIERLQNLPWGLTLSLNGDAMVANQPLISNEQYITGGMDSIRGYKESELAGDNAVHTTVELGRGFQVLDEGKWGGIDMTPYLFYDGAWLTVKEPLDGQDSALSAQGTGIGVRGTLFGFIDYEVDAAQALEDTEEVENGDYEIYFEVKTHF